LNAEKQYRWRATGLLAAVLLLRAGSAGGQNAAKTAEPVTPSQYVGSEMCMGCHEDIYKKGFEETAHFSTAGTVEHGCESCHGPGSEHVEGGGDASKIFRFNTLDREATNRRCLTCHAESSKQAHFSSSAHASSRVSCIDCHSVHRYRRQPLLLESQPKLCYRCHTTGKSDLLKPSIAG
jgi:DmsE family decaheme c-type cytochrome